jgi:hypothetical protein
MTAAELVIIAAVGRNSAQPLFHKRRRPAHRDRECANFAIARDGRADPAAAFACVAPTRPGLRNASFRLPEHHRFRGAGRARKAIL